MGTMGISIEPMTLADLAGVLADHASFWGDRDLRFLHLTALVQEFGETCLTARPGPGGPVGGYLLGFTTPRRVGYIHAVAVRDTARGGGTARELYRRSPGWRRDRVLSPSRPSPARSTPARWRSTSGSASPPAAPRTTTARANR